MKFLITLLLSLTLQSNNSISPNGNYRIGITRKALPDIVGELNYFLINQSTGDSLFLSKSTIRDLMPPLYFWSQDGEKLIFEEKNEHSYKETIKIMELTNKKVTLSVDGFINARSPENYFDQESNTIFFFKRLDIELFKLFSLNIDTGHQRPIKQFKHTGIIETPRILKLDTQAQKITLDFINQDARNQQIVIELE